MGLWCGCECGGRGDGGDGGANGGVMLVGWSWRRWVPCCQGRGTLYNFNISFSVALAENFADNINYCTSKKPSQNCW
jgi:hypothetical protein